MYRDFRVEIFIPAGRKRQMSVLIDNLARFQNIIDKVQVWYNVDEESQAEDAKWLKSLPDIYNDWIDLRFLDKKFYDIKPKQLRTGMFYHQNTIREDTIYVRCDDDIIFLADDFFQNLLDFRIDNPNYFLVMANIINNSACSYIQQEILHTIPDTYGELTSYCMDPVSWGSGPFAETLHRSLIKRIKENAVDEMFFDHADLTDATRFSISCFCFFGKDFAKFDGLIGQNTFGEVRYDEEVWLTEHYPTLNNKLNTICGTALVAHYSFLRQRPYLDKTDILDQYRAIAKGKLSDSYYALLDSEQPETIVEKKSYPVVELPVVPQISMYGDALKAQKAGFRVVESPSKVEIEYKGNVVKTVIGKVIHNPDINRALSAAYNQHHSK